MLEEHPLDKPRVGHNGRVRAEQADGRVGYGGHDLRRAGFALGDALFEEMGIKIKLVERHTFNKTALRLWLKRSEPFIAKALVCLVIASVYACQQPPRRLQNLVLRACFRGR